MVEQRFFRSPQSAAASPPVQNSNRTRIEINSGEAVTETIEIWHHPIELVAKARFIHLKSDCPQEEDVHIALDAQAQKILASRPGRGAT
ncbi:MAG: hypothetical protein ABR955_04285 [Verrucomicrobiota bacterium]|jgi:hypothetical protein